MATFGIKSCWARRLLTLRLLVLLCPGMWQLAVAVPAETPGPVSATANLASDLAVVFTESRDNPIRPYLGMPAAWAAQAAAPFPSFAGRARPGEFFTFQIGVEARHAVGPLALTFGRLAGEHGSIPAANLRCLNLGGTNTQGQAFVKSVIVPAGGLQALWIGVEVPASAQGTYTGTAQLRLTDSLTLPVSIRLQVDGEAVSDHGDSVAKNLSRLRWLDSSAGSEATLTAPFIPVQTAGRTIQVLGRELVLAESGLPARILSHFSPANTHLEPGCRDVLAAPMEFVVETAEGPVTWRSQFRSLQHTRLEAQWRSVSKGAGMRLETTGRLDYTGSGEVALRLVAEQDVAFRDARLETRFQAAAAKYFMGLNHQGGYRPDEWHWKWDTAKRQDCFWLGDVNAGLMLRFKDQNYLRPPVNIYYSFRPLRLPESWGNAGKGGIELERAQAGAVPVVAYSGARQLQRGESLDFVCELYLTPFRTIDTEKQWSTRFIHPGASKDPKPVEDAVAGADSVRGPNVINVHQAGYYNPYINYPYNDDSFPAFCDLVRRAHPRHVRVRAYYTTREITQNMPELLPLHSFNGEIILPGPGPEARTLLNPNGPHRWLVEHLGAEFVPAWVDKVGGKYAELDLSVCTTPDSRWNNFYLEGLRWLVDKSDFDGIYVDDTALDATSLRRARRILDSRPGRLIDFHSWNHFNGYAGFANNLTLYMELLPYLDRLWLGEGFNAGAAAPDYWLVEMSGLPFGLMSEMLEGVNPWRGMLFGETGRLGWAGDPRELWRVWDEYGMQGTEMLPFFCPNGPVQTDNPQVLATVYRGKGRAFIALGSWAATDLSVKLQIDWKALGLDPAKTKIIAPAMKDFQVGQAIQDGEAILVPAGKGLFLVATATSRLR